MKPDRIKNNATASQWWDDLQAQLNKAEKWKPEYEASFAILIDALVGYHETKAELETESEILINPKKGTRYRNPLLDVLSSHVNTITKYSVQFGLTPLADAKIKTEGIGALEPLFAMLKPPS